MLQVSCCVAQVFCNWVCRHVLPGWPVNPRSETQVGTHTHQSKLSTCWNWTETGHPLRLDCKLRPKFSKTETYKHMNSSQALLEHCGQQTCWVRQAAQPKNLWHSCRIAIHAQIVGEANAQIPKFSDSCLCWTPSFFLQKKKSSAANLFMPPGLACLPCIQFV